MNEEALVELFETAIRREVEAQTFYSEAAEAVRDPAVKSILRELAREEEGHERLLWTMKADPTLSAKFAAPADWKVAESVEAGPPPSVRMKPADAFALAMKKEQEAAELYRRLAAWAGDPTVRETYENLANMELGHKRRLEALFVEVAYPEAF